MWSEGSGVRVRTCKVVFIDADTTDMQQWVGVFGYGDASAEFLFGRAKDPSRFDGTPKPFDYRGDAPEDTVGQSPPQRGAAGVGTPFNAPHFAPTAVSIWTDTAKELSKDYFRVASKWMAGDMTVDGLADYATDAAEVLIRAPFAFIEDMTRPRRPARRRHDPQQGAE